jgi:predicted enzyme related to lactoylglutathione lyase
MGGRQATALVRWEGLKMAESAGMGLVLDCHDPETLAPFWAAALGYVSVGAVENYVLLAPDSRPGPKLLLQRVPEEKVGKNRMHLDIEVPDIDNLASRLLELGARRVSQNIVVEHGNRWIVMADPEGNEFCVCDGGAAGD